MQALPIHAVIFDIGMVLLKFDFNRTMERLKRKCRTPSSQIEKVFWDTGLCQSYEMGKISTDDFALGISQALGFEGSPEEVIEAWSDIFSPNPPMIERARAWKRQGIPIYYLSNTCESHVNVFTKQYDIFQIFDGGIFSHLEGCVKPHATIYQTILNRYGLAPEKTLFLDDLAENVAAARKLGMQAIRYEDESRLEKALATYAVRAKESF